MRYRNHKLPISFMTDRRGPAPPSPFQQKEHEGKLIESDQDLFDLFGVENEEGLAWRILQDSSCDVWIRFVPASRILIECQNESWTVQLLKGADGFPWVRGATHHTNGPAGEISFSGEELPPYIIMHLCMDGSNGLTIPWDELAAWELGPDLTENDMVAGGPQGDFGSITFNIDVPIYATLKRSLTVSAAVAGSSLPIPWKTLFFPFTLDQLGQNIPLIEEAVRKSQLPWPNWPAGSFLLDPNKWF